MVLTRDTLVGIVGAVALLVVLGSLLVIAARPGPIERPLEPNTFAVTASGTYTSTPASGTIGPGGTCVPAVPATTCTPARTRLDLRLAGLPETPAGSAYVAFIEQPGVVLPLGPLLRQGDTLVRTDDSERDGAADRRLVVTLEATRDPRAPGRIVAYEMPLGTGTVDLGAERTIALLMARGDVRFNQIGAADVSFTAKATLLELAPLGGWRLHGWSIDAAGELTALGPFTVDSTTARLDARVERLYLADQARFLVTLELSDAAPNQPSALAVYEATV